MAVLTTSLTRLRADFNARFPGRDKASDGWIGDEAHQDTTSGHNPDESGGGEYEDSDSKDEVRAIDVDDDLRDSGGVTMQQVADRIIATPRDIKRLKYMIYNRRIASRSNGWRWESYSGSNPHDQHLHVSGDPAYDEDDAEFTSVTQIGEEEMNQDDFNDLMLGFLIKAYETPDNGDSRWVKARNYLRAFPHTYMMSQSPPYNVLSLLGELKAAVPPSWAKEASVQVVLTNLNALAQALAQGESNPDTAAIIHAIEQSTATSLAAVSAAAVDTRDAVADLGEGGAQQVRAPQEPDSQDG